MADNECVQSELCKKSQVGEIETVNSQENETKRQKLHEVGVRNAEKPVRNQLLKP